MGCNCGKNKKFPPKKSSRMPLKKNDIQESKMCPNERRARIIK